MCFVWIWEQTAIISLYSTNWQVCVTETECGYCALRTGCLITLQLTFRLQRPRHGSGVRRRPLSSKARVQYLSSPNEISGRQTGTGIGFSPSTFHFFPVSSIQTMFHIHHHLKRALVRRTSGRILGNLQTKWSCFQCRRALDTKVISHCFPDFYNFDG